MPSLPAWYLVVVLLAWSPPQIEEIHFSRPFDSFEECLNTVPAIMAQWGHRPIIEIKCVSGEELR